MLCSIRPLSYFMLRDTSSQYNLKSQIHSLETPCRLVYASINDSRADNNSASVPSSAKTTYWFQSQRILSIASPAPVMCNTWARAPWIRRYSEETSRYFLGSTLRKSTLSPAAFAFGYKGLPSSQFSSRLSSDTWWTMYMPFSFSP